MSQTSADNRYFQYRKSGYGSKNQSGKKQNERQINPEESLAINILSKDLMSDQINVINKKPELCPHTIYGHF